MEKDINVYNTGPRFVLFMDTSGVEMSNLRCRGCVWKGIFNKDQKVITGCSNLSSRAKGSAVLDLENVDVRQALMEVESGKPDPTNCQVLAVLVEIRKAKK